VRNCLPHPDAIGGVVTLLEMTGCLRLADHHNQLEAILATPSAPLLRAEFTDG